MNLDTLNRGDLYEEIAELARAEGITDQAGWNTLVDEVLEDHQDIGELNDDQDLEGKRQALHQMWAEYHREAGEETAGAIGEDPEAPHG